MKKQKYIIRLPDGMRERIKEEAERNCRSMNAEIVFHLERALFDQYGDLRQHGSLCPQASN